MGSATDRSAKAKTFVGVALRQTTVVAFEQVGHEVSEENAPFPVQPPNDAKIDKDHLAFTVDEHVSGMLIAVEEAVVENGLKEAGRRIGQYLREIMSGGTELVALVDVDAVDALHDQHALRGHVPERLGRAQAAAIFEVSRHLIGCCCFHAQIQLHGRLFAQDIDDADGLSAA